MSGRSRKMWWLGSRLVEDPATAMALAERGWLLQEVSDGEVDGDQSSDDEQERGPCLKRRRHVAVEMDEGQSPDDFSP